MRVLKTSLSGVLILEPKIFSDSRGFFYESWNQGTMKEVAGISDDFVQDNHSRSSRGVLRGLHYQLERPQGKLVRVVMGCVLDVVVDLRTWSSTFGQHFTIELNDKNHRELWVPAGIGHGFVVLSNAADFLYKTTDYYMPEYERCIRWDDPYLNIDWQLNYLVPSISEKDTLGTAFKKAEYFA